VILQRERLGEGLTTPHHKEKLLQEKLHRASELTGSCEHGNELSGYVKGKEFLD
jgi:hypothetical protein